MVKSQQELNEELLSDIESRETKKPLRPNEIVRLERELRRYVRKGNPGQLVGGFRKGLPKEDEKKAKRLMKALGRDKVAWDITILVPGFPYD